MSASTSELATGPSLDDLTSLQPEIPLCGSALLDREGRVVAVDGAWLRLHTIDAAQDRLWALPGQLLLATSVDLPNASTQAVARSMAQLLSGQCRRIDQTFRCSTGTDLRWFKILARQTDRADGAVAITQLEVTELQQARARLALQSTVARALTSKLPMLATCRLLALALCEELEWDFAGIWTLDVESWSLRCTDTWVRPKLGLQDFERLTRKVTLGPNVGVPGRVWSTANAHWVSDTDLDRDKQPAFTIMPPAMHLAGFRTGVCFPLRCGDDVLAVVEVFSRSRRLEDRALMELLEALGEKVALWELRERAENCAAIAQQDADDAHDQLASVLDCTPAFITAIDAGGDILFLNKSIPPERKARAIGAPWRDYVLPESHLAVEAALHTVLETGSACTYEAKVALPNGKWLWFSNQMGPMRRRESIVGVVIVSQDVTASKLASDELLAAQRLAAVGTLAAGVAHEINTPLQFINDSVYFLRDSVREVFALLEPLRDLRRLHGDHADEPALAAAMAAATAAEEEADPDYLREHMPKAFERCFDGLERVAAIVRSMKEFAFSAQHDMAPVDLNQAIMATLAIARSEYNHVAEMETHFGSLPPVTCHANEIKQVVLNIVVNAAHAIADRQHKGERGLIVVTTTREGDLAVISIGDNGDGIPEPVRPRVFEPFFTTKEVGRGTGQGLAIAWNVVKDRHHGELTFETGPGVGTTFRICLPIDPRPPSTP